MLDFVAEHPWICLFTLIGICVSWEYFVNRDNWKKRSAEIILSFVGVFAAIVFALAQGKLDREVEGKDKALTLFKAVDIEMAALMAETGEENIINLKEGEKNSSKTPMFEALLKEPEVLSRLPANALYMLSSNYRNLTSLKTMEHENFEELKYILCAMRTSVEIEKSFEDKGTDEEFWVQQVKKSCGSDEGLPTGGPGNLPFAEDLVDALISGPNR